MSKRLSEDSLAVWVAMIQGSDGSILKNSGFGGCTRVGAGSYSIVTPLNMLGNPSEFFVTTYLLGQVGRAQIQTLIIANAINVTICNDAGAALDSNWGIKVERI